MTTYSNEFINNGLSGNSINNRNSEYTFQCVETRLKDETYLNDDDELQIEYSIQKAEAENNLPFSIEIESALLVLPNGNISDEDLLSLLDEDTINRIEEEISEQL